MAGSERYDRLGVVWLVRVDAPSSELMVRLESVMLGRSVTDASDVSGQRRGGFLISGLFDREVVNNPRPATILGFAWPK